MSNETFQSTQPELNEVLQPYQVMATLPQGGRAYDLDLVESREAALKATLSQGNQVIRIIGGCDSERSLTMVERTVSRGLRKSEFSGTVFIDPGKSAHHSLGNIAPKLELELNTAAKVYETTSIQEDGAKANSIISFARQFLSREPGSHYHLVVAGGSGTTRTEYNETLDQLSKAFPGRVHITILYGAGGDGDKLAEQSPPMVNVCTLSGEKFSRYLNQTSIAPVSKPLASQERSFTSGAEELRREFEALGRHFLSAEQRGQFNRLSARIADRVAREDAALKKRFSGELSGSQLQQLNREARIAARELLEMGVDRARSDSFNPGTVLLRRAARIAGEIVSEMSESARGFAARVKAFSAREILVGDKIADGGGFIVVTEKPVARRGGEAVLLTGVLFAPPTPVQSIRKVLPLSLDSPLTVDRFRIPLPERTTDHDPVSTVLPRGRMSTPLPIHGMTFSTATSWNLVIDSSPETVTLLSRGLEDRSRLVLKELSKEQYDAMAVAAKSVRRIDLRDEKDRADVLREASSAGVLKALDPIAQITSGTILAAGSERLVIATDTKGEKGAYAISEDGAARVSSLVIAAADSVRVGTTGATLASPIVLGDFPELSPSWEALSHGGVIQYRDSRGVRVAVEEVLTVREVAQSEESRSRMFEVESIFTDLGNNTCRVQRRERSALDLVLPPENLPSVLTVDVYAGHRKTESRLDVPEKQPQRSHHWISYELEQSLQHSIFQAFELFKSAGRNALCNHLIVSDNPDASAGFEDMLAQHKELYRMGTRAIEECREWCGRVITQHPELVGIFSTLSHTLASEKLSDGAFLERLAPGLDGLAGKVREINDSVEDGTRKIGSSLAMSLEMLARQVRLQSFVRMHPGAPDVTVFSAVDFREEDLTQCQQIAAAVAIPMEKVSAENPVSKYFQRGGFLINDFSVDYFKDALTKGGRLVIHATNSEQGKREVNGFELIYTPEFVPDYFKHLVPVARNDDRAALDVICAKKTGVTGILNRVSLLELQYTNAEYIDAMVNAFNEPSMRMLDRTGYTLRSDSAMDQHGVVVDEMFHFPTWEMAVSPERRAHWAERTILSRDEALERRPILNQDHKGGTEASAYELDQMRAIKNAVSAENAIRFSLSFDSEGGEQFRTIIAEGLFDQLQGVVSWSESRSAYRRGETYVLASDDVAAIMEPVAKDADSHFQRVGFVGTQAGKTVSVVTGEGENNALVLEDRQEPNGQIRVFVPRDYPVVRGIVRTEVTDSMQNVEERRAREFAQMFRSEVGIYAGGVEASFTASDIAEHLHRIAARSGGSGAIVLLQGFGGATDEISVNAEFLKAVSRLESELGRQLVYVVNPLTDMDHARHILYTLGCVGSPLMGSTRFVPAVSARKSEAPTANPRSNM